MKKRRELDALVTSGKAPKNGRHELLRNESDSSEVEEFSMPQKTVVRKRVRSQCCSTCVTMCSIFLLVICMVSIGGLIWMVIELKNEVSDVRNRIISAETVLKDTTEKINEIETRDSAARNRIISLGEVVPVLQTNISDLNKRLQAMGLSLQELVDTASKTSADASQTGSEDIQNKLPQAVADLGSSLRSVQLQQEALNTMLTALQTNLSDTATMIQAHTTSQLKNMQLEFQQLSSDLTTVNDTLSQTCGELNQLILIERGDLNNVMNWTSEFRKEMSVNRLDQQLIKNAIAAEVERNLSAISVSANESSQLELLRKELASRIDALEAVENDQILNVLNLTFDVNQLNLTLRTFMTRSLHHDQLLNETTHDIVVRLEQLETDVANFKTVDLQTMQELEVTLRPVDAENENSKAPVTRTTKVPVTTVTSSHKNTSHN